MRVLVLVVAIIGTTNGAHAGEREHVSSEFSYSQQQFQSESGTQRVLERLSKTARDACLVAKSVRQMVPGRVNQKCVDQMMTDAISKIDNPKLTETYRLHRKRR